MSQAVLSYIDKQLTEAGVPYEFAEWTSKAVNTYFVGEYSETPPSEEDGSIESTFILNGFTNSRWIDLEELKEKIEKLFTYCTTILDDGSAVDVAYAGAQIIPTGNATLKRIQINLTIKEWRVI